MKARTHHELRHPKAAVRTRYLFVGFLLLGSLALRTSASRPRQGPIISDAMWGNITGPVYGTSETCCGGSYAQAELFAGPNKLGSYFAGALPNGSRVTPAGTSIQIGRNPLVGTGGPADND
jgi:hypothetical protein